MPNDTPPDTPGNDLPSGFVPEGDPGPVVASEESQASFISERNEQPEPGVQTHMDDTTHTTQDEDRPVESTGTVDPVHFDAPDTGEIIVEPVPATADATLFMPTTGSPDSEQAQINPPFQADDQDLISVPVAPNPEPRQGEPSSRNRTGGSTLMFIVVAIVSGVVGALLTHAVLTATGAFDSEVASPPTVVTTTVAATPIVTQITNSAGAAVNPTVVAQKVIPSIVTVNVYEGAVDSEEGRFATGSGSGVVMSAEGYLITNHHVIDGADSYDVTFEDGRTYEATLVGSDSLTDLAVLEISADDLVPVDFGSADALAVGDPAIAVGNPLGQQGGASITVGIISAFDRRVDFADETSLFGMIQTDAAINSGSSGGALVNAEGELVGITSAIGVSTAGPEGIGYAIPVELVERITSEIIETGDVAHPFLGVTVATFFATANDGAVFPGGAVIESIEGTDSAAGDAGILAGDVVVDIGGEPVASQTDLILAVRLYRVGDVVTFTVDRDGEVLTFDVTMGQRPPEFQG